MPEGKPMKISHKGNTFWIKIYTSTCDLASQCMPQFTATWASFYRFPGRARAEPIKSAVNSDQLAWNELVVWSPQGDGSGHVTKDRWVYGIPLKKAGETEWWTWILSVGWYVQINLHVECCGRHFFHHIIYPLRHWLFQIHEPNIDKKYTMHVLLQCLAPSC